MGKEKDEVYVLKYSCSCINFSEDPWSYVSRPGSLSSETRLNHTPIENLPKRRMKYYVEL